MSFCGISQMMSLPVSLIFSSCAVPKDTTRGYPHGVPDDVTSCELHFQFMWCPLWYIYIAREWDRDLDRYPKVANGINEMVSVQCTSSNCTSYNFMQAILIGLCVSLGIGLSLCQCKRTIRRLQGDITVVSFMMSPPVSLIFSSCGVPMDTTRGYHCGGLYDVTSCPQAHKHTNPQAHAIVSR